MSSRTEQDGRLTKNWHAVFHLAFQHSILHARHRIFVSRLNLLSLLVRYRPNTAQLALLKERPRQHICVRSRTLVRPILAHEARVRGRTHADSFLEFANVHLAVVDEGSDLAAAK